MRGADCCNAATPAFGTILPMPPVALLARQRKQVGTFLDPKVTSLRE
jgi:hypothetical protein